MSTALFDECIQAGFYIHNMGNAKFLPGCPGNSGVSLTSNTDMLLSFSPSLSLPPSPLPLSPLPPSPLIPSLHLWVVPYQDHTHFHPYNDELYSVNIRSCGNEITSFETPYLISPSYITISFWANSVYCGHVTIT